MPLSTASGHQFFLILSEAYLLTVEKKKTLGKFNITDCLNVALLCQQVLRWIIY